MYKVCMCVCVLVTGVQSDTLFLYSYIYIFIISVKLIMILHIHLAVIRTFSISVSSPDCLKLQFRHLQPQWRQGLEYAQYYRTALLFKGFKEKTEREVFFSGDFLIRIFRPRVVGVAWAELIPPHWSAPVRGRGWLGFSRFVFIFSTSKLYKNMQHTSWPKSMWN